VEGCGVGGGEGCGAGVGDCREAEQGVASC
jgi:hypothetical protein